MTLVTESIPIPISGGLEEGKATRLVNPPALCKAENVRVRKEGRIEKRLGKTALATTGLTTWSYGGAGGTLGAAGSTDSAVITAALEGNTVFEASDQVALLTNGGVMTYDSDQETWRRNTSHSIYPTEVDVLPLAVADRNPCNPSMAIANGVMAVVWEETTQARCFIAFYDATTFALLSPPQLLDSNIISDPQIVAFNTTWFAVLGLNGSNNGRFQRYNTSVGDYVMSSVGVAGGSGPVAITADIAGPNFYTLRSSAGTTIDTWDSTGTHLATVNIGGSLSLPAHFGAVYIHSIPALFVVMRNNGNTEYQLHRCNGSAPSASSASVTICLSTTIPDWLSLRGKCSLNKYSGDRLVWLIGEQLNTSDISLNAEGGTLAVICTITPTVVEFYPATHLCPTVGAAICPTDSATTLFGVHNDMEDYTPSAGGGGLVAHGFAAYPSLFVARLTSKNSQAVYAEAQRKKDFEIIARVMDNPGAGRTDDVQFMSPFIANSDNKLLCVATQIIERPTLQQQEDTVGRRLRLVLVSLKFPDTYEQRVIETPTGCLTTGGCVGFFDGYRGAEVSSHDCPHVMDFSATNTGATAGTYYTIGWSLVATWTDRHGRLHRSAPSPAFSRTPSASGQRTDTITMDVMMPRGAVNGDLFTELSLELYLSDFVTSTVTPTAAHLLQAEAAAKKLVKVYSLADGTYVPAEGVYTFSYQITGTNFWSTLTTKSLYTETELSSDPTFASVSIAANSSYVFYVPATRDRVFHSKPLTITNPPEFNDALQILTPAEGGRVQAVEVMDDKLIIFKDDKVFVTSVAYGPDANGAGQSFPVPRLIPTDGGCTNARSVVSAPPGVFYQSQRGIYMIDRNLRSMFVGSKVQDTFGTATITAAKVYAAASEVRFHTDAREVMVYNYQFDNWYSFTLSDYQSAWVSSNKYYTLGLDNNVELEDLGAAVTFATTEGNGQIIHSMETGWINLAGIEGYQRIKRINIGGEYYSGDIFVTLAYDYISYTESYTFQSGDLANNSDVLSLRIKPARQKCRAIKIGIQQVDNEGETPARGFAIEGIQIEVARKRTNNKNVDSIFSTNTPG